MLELHRAVYVSRAVAGVGRTTLSIAEILSVSDRNNRRDGLTGMLIFHDGWFIQALEGSRVAIERLLRVLREDPRHDGLRLLDLTPITARSFGAWGMGLAAVTPALTTVLRDADLAALRSPEALRLLRAAADELDRAAV